MSLVLQEIRGVWCIVETEPENDNFYVFFIGPDLMAAEAMLAGLVKLNTAQYEIWKKKQQDLHNVVLFPGKWVH